MPQSNLLVGVLMMALAMLLLPTGDGVGKYLLGKTTYSPEFLSWSRFVVGVALLLPIAIARGWLKGLGLSFYLKQALRAALVMGAITLILNGLKTIEMSDAYGAFFIGPVVATVLARVLLRETVTVKEWTAVALGFTGVLLVVQPSFEMNVGVLWALAAGTCYGGLLVATRWAAGSGPPMAQLTAQLFFAMIFLMPLGLPDFLENGVQEPVLLGLQSLISAAANLLTLLAMARAPAAWLAPVVYLQILSATSLGWLVFGHQPGGYAAIGLVLILAAGLSRIPRKRAQT